MIEFDDDDILGEKPDLLTVYRAYELSRQSLVRLSKNHPDPDVRMDCQIHLAVDDFMMRHILFPRLQRMLAEAEAREELRLSRLRG